MKVALRHFALALPIGILVVGCATNDLTGPSSQPQPSSGEQGPVAERPTWTVGSYWYYEGTSAQGQAYGFAQSVQKIGERDGQKYYLLSEQSRLPVHYYNEDLNLTTLLTARGDVDDFGAPYPSYFNWPLYVGKVWSESNSRTWDGSWTFTNHFRVLVYENVNTYAGTFGAFKVSRQEMFRGRVGIHEEYWYAPAVRKIVKFQRTFRDGSEFKYSLIRYGLR